jgi:predicted anti-sigma-YlaC factor YlaD
MEHEHALALVPRYLDQELALAETLKFEQHLKGCAQCREAYSEQREVSTQLKQAGLRIDAPRALAKRIQSMRPIRPARQYALADGATSCT